MAYINDLFRSADTWVLGRNMSGHYRSQPRSRRGPDRAQAASGRDIMLSCGPELLAPLASAPGLIDEYPFAVHPMVLSTGKRVFDDMTTDLPLRLAHAKVFDAAAVVLRYEPLAL